MTHFLTPALLLLCLTAQSLVAVEATGEAMARPCQEMAAEHTRLNDEIRAQDVLLTERLTAWKALAPEARAAGSEALVLLLAEQRLATNQRRLTMADAMTRHMGQHCGQGKGGMMACPMMQPPAPAAVKP